MSSFPYGARSQRARSIWLAPEELAGMDASEIREHVALYAQRWGFDSYLEQVIGVAIHEFGMPRTAVVGGLRDDLRLLRSP